MQTGLAAIEHEIYRTLVSLYIPTVNSLGVHQAHGFGQYSMQSIVPKDHVLDAVCGDTNEGDL
jgi:hypothetical protein